MQYCLEADLLAPGRARDLLSRLSESRPPSGWHEDALLVLSELVTNVVRHGEGRDLVIELEVSGDDVHVAVTQRASFPTPRPPLTPAGVAWTQESGRGLFLVDHLARRWGTDPLPDGRLRVWADVCADA